jgi:hypothetical protein
MLRINTIGYGARSSKSRWVRRGTGIGVPSNVMALSRERHDRIMLETATRDFHVAQQPQEIRFFGSSRTVRRRLLQRQMDYQSRSANSHMPGDEQHRMFGQTTQLDFLLDLFP